MHSTLSGNEFSLRLNFQSRCQFPFGFFFFLFFEHSDFTIPFYFQSLRSRIPFTPPIINRENSNFEKGDINLLHSLEISNRILKTVRLFFFLILRIKKGKEREKEHTRLTKMGEVEFGYRAFLLNKFPSEIPTRDVSIMKSLVFSGQTTRLTSFLPFVHGIVFPLLLSLLGYFPFFPSLPSERSIVKSCPALRDPSLHNPFTSPAFHARLLLLHL